MNAQRIIRMWMAALAVVILAGCQVLRPMATLTPTALPSPTRGLMLPAVAPTSTPLPPLPEMTPTLESTLLPTVASTPGPETYAVILVEPGDTLSVRDGPGTGHRMVAALPYDATDVLLTGQRAQVGEATWVEIQRASDPKASGRVNAWYLTRHIASAEFCNDPQALALIERFSQAIVSADGQALASLVSPVHGLSIWLWRSGRAITFDQAHARWVFRSTYQHNWGMHPASGMDTKGAFREVVLPNLNDALVNPHEMFCNDRSVPGLDERSTWPEVYKNINLYKIYKPATPGIDLDWRIWLVGVEWVENHPYLFALVHFQWEP